MAATDPIKVTIDASAAINLTDTSEINVSSKVQRITSLEAGSYKVNFTGNLNFNGANLVLEQIFVFSTAPLTTGNPQGWYFVVNQGENVIIESDGNNPVYVFLVDQVTSGDNSGSAEVTFTKLNP